MDSLTAARLTASLGAGRCDESHMDNATKHTDFRARWSLAITGAAVFMTPLESPRVGAAPESVRVDLGGSIGSRQWADGA